MPASYAEDDLAEGRAALLSGWSSGSEPGLVITRASGALVWDSKGNEYIDCTSMAWSNNIGASVPEVVEAAHPLISDIRGPGLLIGIELVRDQQTREPAAAETLEVYRRAMELGVIFGTTRYAGLGNVLKVKPPFTITRAQMDRVLDVLDQVLTAIENR